MPFARRGRRCQGLWTPAVAVHSNTSYTPPSWALYAGPAALALGLILVIALLAPRKKAQLRTWAWASGAFVLVGFLLVGLALVAWH